MPLRFSFYSLDSGLQIEGQPSLLWAVRERLPALCSAQNFRVPSSGRGSAGSGGWPWPRVRWLQSGSVGEEGMSAGGSFQKSSEESILFIACVHTLLSQRTSSPGPGWRQGTPAVCLCPREAGRRGKEAGGGEREAGHEVLLLARPPHRCRGGVAMGAEPGLGPGLPPDPLRKGAPAGVCLSGRWRLWSDGWVTERSGRVSGVLRLLAVQPELVSPRTRAVWLKCRSFLVHVNFIICGLHVHEAVNIVFHFQCLTEFIQTLSCR